MLGRDRSAQRHDQVVYDPVHALQIRILRTWRAIGSLQRIEVDIAVAQVAKREHADARKFPSQHLARPLETRRNLRTRSRNIVLEYYPPLLARPRNRHAHAPQHARL